MHMTESRRGGTGSNQPPRRLVARDYFLIVSTTCVEGLAFAVLIGVKRPVMALRPILVVLPPFPLAMIVSFQ